MSIALTPEQLCWLEQAVADGRFASVEDAVRMAVVGLMTEPPDEIEDDEDDNWVAPLLDEARASDARGESMSLEDFKAHALSRRERSA
jgi:Arc/MetJ-type ribon-helix-helix transcriptional regulator